MRGWVTVTPTTDEPQRRFAVGATILVGEAPRTVRDARLSPRVALLLDGCEDRAAAEALRGQWLYVEADQAPPEAPDEYYDHQLEGLAVVVAATRVGRIAEVLHLPGQDVLAVDLDSGRQVLVPFVSQMVPEVDLAAGQVVVAPVEGLFDAD